MASDYFVCPNCGAEVPARKPACPECGSDGETGWSEDTLYDGIDFLEGDEPITEDGGSLFVNRTFLFLVAIAAILVFLGIYLF